MSEQYGRRPPSSPQVRNPPHPASGTSRLPMQALGGPPPEVPDPYGGYSADAYPAPPPPARRSKALDWTLKGLGLLGVAVVSGFLWWLFRHQSPPTGSTTPPVAQAQGKYQFVPFHSPVVSSNCADDSEKKVKDYFEQHACVSMTRSLYTTTLDGQTVFTSVILVQMPSAAQASALDSVSRQDNSGHVHDLVEDKITSIPGGPHWLEDAGYESTVSGTDVVIATTEYQNNSLDSAANLSKTGVDDGLKGVSQDALNQKLLKN